MSEGHGIEHNIATEHAEEVTFLEAGEWFATLVDTIPQNAWNGPGLGEWDLRALVGHTSRALSTVLRGISQPAPAVACETAADYVIQTASIQAGSALTADGTTVTERGIAAGRDLGEHPADAVRALLNETRAVLRTTAGQDPIITTIVGGMRLHQYLRTRTFELIVHGLDVQTALSRNTAVSGWSAAAPPAAALAQSLDHAMRVAMLQGDGPSILLSLTGRRGLPDGYSVLAPSNTTDHR